MTAATARRSDLAIRTVTGIALILVALACIVYGRDPWWLLMSAAAMTMIVEWAGLIGVERWRSWIALAGMGIVMLTKQTHIDVPYLAEWYTLAGMTVLVGLVTMRLRLAVGMLYAGLPTLSLFTLHERYDNIGITLWTLAIVWATDIGAYFAGRTIGGPKLAPVLSPNKTWAGLIGGIVSAIVVGFLLASWLDLSPHLPGFAGLLAVAAQGGDLYESAMKRRAGVKDSGHILPGHGGAMDRLDGVVPVACLVGLLSIAGLI